MFYLKIAAVAMIMTLLIMVPIWWLRFKLHISEHEHGRRDAIRAIQTYGVDAAFARLRFLAENPEGSTEAYRLGYSDTVLRAQLGADYIKRS